MNQKDNLDLNFKTEEIIKAVIESLSNDDMLISSRRDFIIRVLIYRRERIYGEYKKEVESYERLYGHYKEDDKVPKKVNNKIIKINRMVRRLEFLDSNENRTAGYVPYNKYFDVIEKILKEVLGITKQKGKYYKKTSYKP